MKTKLLLISILFSAILFGQDSVQIEKNETRFIAFTPLSKKIDKVNGLAIGVGMDDILLLISPKKIINGLNVDINPLGFLLFCFYDTSKIQNTTDVLQQNGLNISLAGPLRNQSNNGINLSMYNYGNKMTGVSVAAVGNVVEELNGVFISVMGNYAEKGSGLTIAAFNEVKEFNGAQIGVVNISNNAKGIQIGLINKNTKGRNFQIGFWNKNAKRTVPIINF